MLCSLEEKGKGRFFSGCLPSKLMVIWQIKNYLIFRWQTKNYLHIFIKGCIELIDFHIKCIVHAIMLRFQLRENYLCGPRKKPSSIWGPKFSKLVAVKYIASKQTNTCYFYNGNIMVSNLLVGIGYFLGLHVSVVVIVTFSRVHKTSPFKIVLSQIF